MVNEWLECFRPEAVLGLLETTLSTAHGHTLTEDQRDMLRKLTLPDPSCTARKLYRAISMLLPSDGTGDEIAYAITKADQILDREMFRDNLWSEVIVAFKKIEETQSAEIVN